jgi:membrane protein DedA with SNARE-associated domain
MDGWLEQLQLLQGLPAYALVFGLLVACGIGAPMNEDIVLLAAAALTLTGVMQPVPLIVVAWFGLIAGDALIFHWGYRYGGRILRHRWFARILPEQRLTAMQQRVQRGGPASIFVIRFLPGIRTALFFAAGTLKIPYRTFFLFNGLAAAIELPLLVFGVRYIGGRWKEILPAIQQAQVWLLAAVIGFVALVIVLRRLRSRAKTKPTPKATST